MLIVKTGYTKAVHPETRTVQAVISTPDPDRQGDVVEVSGWQLENFLRNPVVLWMHRHDAPVARCVDIRKTRTGLVATARFATTPLAEEIWQLYKQGVLRAWSVSFIAHQWEPLPSGGKRFTKQELLEYSCVSVPANPNALSLAHRQALARLSGPENKNDLVIEIKED